jgi:hypothetical protein
MNLASILLYPFMLLLPAAGGGDSGKTDSGKMDSRAVVKDSIRSDAAESSGYAVPDDAWPDERTDSSSRGIISAFAFQHPEPEDAWQVRIEQRMTIRITPRAQLPMDPDGPGSPMDRDPKPRFTERKIGKCLPIAGIAGVEPDGQHNLLLFMRDRRIISAELERGCRAGSFYSGFLLSRSPDGQLCVDRDSLLSRSGSNCKLTRIRQLVASGR